MKHKNYHSVPEPGRNQMLHSVLNIDVSETAFYYTTWRFITLLYPLPVPCFS